MHSVKLGFVAAALLLGTTALTSPAFAGNEGGCHKDCYTPPPPQGGGDVDVDNTAVGIGVGVGIGYGGKGGEGGKGGNGGKGGDAEVKNSGNSFNANINKNEIENKNYNTNLNANFNKNDNYNRNSNHQSQDQDQHQAQGQIQGQAQKVEDSGNSSVEINNERPPVSTAYSAALATSEDTCMGSSSIGGQGVGFGLTIGTTWTDDNCRRLKNSRQLVALGYHRAGTALMCLDEDVKNAMIQAGTPCPSGQVYVAPAVYIPPPAPAREYAPMAPVPDRPVRRRHKKVLPPK